jgi:hypothetical protein
MQIEDIVEQQHYKIWCYTQEERPLKYHDGPCYPDLKVTLLSLWGAIARSMSID